jgi:hypothetical protein
MLLNSVSNMELSIIPHALILHASITFPLISIATECHGILAVHIVIQLNIIQLFALSREQMLNISRRAKRTLRQSIQFIPLLQLLLQVLQILDPPLPCSLTFLLV